MTFAWRSKNIDRDRIQMTTPFVFSDGVFDNGQKLFVSVAKLAASKDNAAFIGKFCCDEYFRHNRDLLLYEHQGGNRAGA